MTEAPSTDGRNARRDRNRIAVLDAAIELFASGELQPSPQAVADRSGVSLRSVYRYYDDVDDLMRAAISRSFERNLPRFEIDGLGEGRLDDRIDRLVERRASLHEHLAPMARAAAARARSSEQIRDRIAERRALLAAQEAAMFAPELEGLNDRDRADLLLAVGLVVGFDAFERLRTVEGCSATTARRVAARSLRALLSDAQNSRE